MPRYICGTVCLKCDRFRSRQLYKGFGSNDRGVLVGCEHVLVRARPVGQRRARDGGLRLRVLRACAVISQQRVYLHRGVVGQQCACDGAGRLRVLRCPCAVVSQQSVHLRRGVVGQQGCCYSSVSARRGVAVCRDAQRVVAVGQRSRERSPQMQVANDGFLLAESAAFVAYEASSAVSALAPWSAVTLASRLASCAATKASVARPSRAFAILATRPPWRAGRPARLRPPCRGGRRPGLPWRQRPRGLPLS